MTMLDDALTITGRVQLELRDEYGRLKQLTEVPNLVHTMGKGVIAARMVAAQALPAVSHMAVGTGSIAPGAGDQTLQAEVARIALTSTNVAAAVITYGASFGPGVGTGALQEAGLFCNGTPGSGLPGLARTTFAVINKAAGDTLNVSWTVTIG
jgi:hypothetical protein